MAVTDRIETEAPVVVTSHDRSRRDHLTAALDMAVVIASACVVAASLGADDLWGRRWMALGFVLFGPGWALQRQFRRLAGAESVFVAVGTSLATVAVAGHLTVTLLSWHWAPIMVGLGTATGASVLLQRWRADVRGGGPTLSWGAAPSADGASEHWLAPRAWWAVAGAGALGGFAALAGLLSADAADIDGRGLVSALPASVWIGAGVALAAVIGLLGPRPRDHVAMAALLALATFVIHGAPGLVEPHPRFPVAWLHVGFVEQVSADGALLRDFDARFSWPGFFAGGGLLDRAAGTEGTLWLVRFTPVVVTLLGCLGIWVLGRLLGFGAVAAGAAATLFVALDWAGQDYFSPQATAFILYLTVLVVVLRWFGGAGPASGSRLAALLRLRDAAAEPAPAPGSTPAMGVRVLAVVALSWAMVVTHQLTPGFLTVVLLCLGVTGLIRLRWLGVMVALLTAAWLSFGGEAWWLGHLDTLTGSVGDVGGIVEDNVSERTGGATASRNLVLQARLGLSAAVWLTVSVLLARSWWRGPSRSTLVLAAMFGAPFPLLALQPYGGELLIRIYFLVLVPALLILTTAMFPVDGPALVRRAGLAVVVVSLLPVFALARFGNEQFEMVTDGDLATARVLLEQAPDDSVVFIANGQTLVNVARVGDLRYVSVDSPSAVSFQAALDDIDPSRGRFVYLTRSQDVFVQQTTSREAGWLHELGDELVATGDFEVHRHRPGGSVLEYRP